LDGKGNASNGLQCLVSLTQVADIQYKAGMKTLAAILLAIVALSGCTVSSSGSQSLEVDPSKYGTGEQAIAPANGHGYFNGEKLDHRN
jgi:hypothetical protein